MARPPENRLSPAPSTPTPLRILPMQLEVAERLVDDSTGGGKSVPGRVERVKQRGVTVTRSRMAHERVAVKPLHRRKTDVSG